MSKEYATLRVPEKELSEARKAKKDNETWGEYLLRCADADIPQKWTANEIDARIERKLDDLRSEMRR